MEFSEVVYKYASNGGQDLRGNPESVLAAVQDNVSVTNEMLNVLHDACEHIEDYSLEPKLWEPLWALLYLGQTGCTIAHKEILRFISLGHESIDSILGCYRHGMERLPFLLYNTASGDFGGCFSALDNTAISVYVRNYIAETLVMAMIHGDIKKEDLLRFTRERLQHATSINSAELAASYIHLATELHASELYDEVSGAQQIPGITEIAYHLSHAHEELDDDEDYVNFLYGDFSYNHYINEGFLEAVDSCIGNVYEYTFEDMVRIDAKYHAAEAQARGVAFSEEAFINSSLAEFGDYNETPSLPARTSRTSTEKIVKRDGESAFTSTSRILEKDLLGLL